MSYKKQERCALGGRLVSPQYSGGDRVAHLFSFLCCAWLSILDCPFGFLYRLFAISNTVTDKILPVSMIVNMMIWSVFVNKKWIWFLPMHYCLFWVLETQLLILYECIYAFRNTNMSSTMYNVEYCTGIVIMKT